MKLLLSLLCTAAAASASAQSPAPVPARHQLLEFGLGQSVNGSGDYTCLKSHLGYTRLIGKHLGVTGRLAMISGAGSIYFEWDKTHYMNFPTTYHAINVESEALYAPFGNDRRFVFALGAGAYVGYTKQYDFASAGYRLDENLNPVFEYNPQITKGYHLGYLASLNFDYAVDYQERWLLGLKLALQNDTFANILPGAQLKLSRRL